MALGRAPLTLRFPTLSFRPFTYDSYDYDSDPFSSKPPKILQAPCNGHIRKHYGC